jgi:hypothetical protein
MIEKKTDDAYQLGAWVGRKQAFAALAGRCSAADAECLRQARESKQYRALGLGWRQFCKQRIGISRATADRIIERLEEFGPQYFILAQATGMSAQEYRRISGAVHGQLLLHAGEEIPINPENAPRLAAAVEALRQQAPPAPPDGVAGTPAAALPLDLTRALEKLERTLDAAVRQIERLHAAPLERAERDRLLRTVIAQLHRIPMFQFTELRRVS